MRSSPSASPTRGPSQRPWSSRNRRSTSPPPTSTATRSVLVRLDRLPSRRPRGSDPRSLALPTRLAAYRPGAARGRGGRRRGAGWDPRVVRGRGGRPSYVPGVSWRPGQAVTATRRPGREGFVGKTAQGRWFAGRDGTGRRHRSSLRPYTATKDERCRETRDGRVATPASHLKRRHVPGISLTRRDLVRDTHRTLGALPAGLRPSPGATPSLSLHPHPRPSRARPQPARAVAETAASLPRAPAFIMAPSFRLRAPASEGPVPSPSRPPLRLPRARRPATLAARKQLPLVPSSAARGRGVGAASCVRARPAA